MVTWLLWRALQSPPTKNPLYRKMQLVHRASWLDRFWNGLLAVLVLSILYPYLVQADVSPVLAMLIGCIALVGYIALLREVVTTVLWRLISRQLNTARDEMRQMMLGQGWMRS